MKPAMTPTNLTASGARTAPDDLPGRDRKAEHIRLALDASMQLGGYGLDGYVLEHRALPEVDGSEIDTRVEFLGRSLALPLVVSCMTGGTPEATRINRHLATGAQETGVALGVGSQRRALDDPALAESFAVRRFAPGVPLLANLGAVQLNYGFGVDHCRRAVEMIEADALVLHLNPLQEAIQPEGQRNFAGLLSKIERVVRDLPVPVIVKEVGCGLSGATGRALFERGVRIVDTAGVGGTSWARIEGQRASDPALGELFAHWGIPTARSIRELAAIEGLTVIGSGGLRHGVDLALALALGADLGAMAYRFLEAASRSTEEVVSKVRRTSRELEIAMFCAGARNVADLQRARVLCRHTWVDA